MTSASSSTDPVYAFVKSVLDFRSTTAQAHVNLPSGKTSLDQLLAYASSNPDAPPPYAIDADATKQDSQFRSAENILLAVDGVPLAGSMILTDDLVELATLEGAARWYDNQLRDWYIRGKISGEPGNQPAASAILRHLEDLAKGHATIVGAIADTLADPTATLGNYLYIDMADLAFILSTGKKIGSSDQLAETVSELHWTWNGLASTAGRLRRSARQSSGGVPVNEQLQGSGELKSFEKAFGDLARCAAQDYEAWMRGTGVSESQAEV